MEPKYATLAEFIAAILSGKEKAKGITVWLDNDHICAVRGNRKVWDEDFGPSETCEALFKVLGLHAEPV